MCIKFHFDSSWGADFNTRLFRTSTNKIIYVTGFQNGKVSIDATPGVEIEEFAEIIEACFDDSESNFYSELLKAFKFKENAAFDCVYINFYDIKLLIRKEEARKSYIISKFNVKREKNNEILVREKEKKASQSSILELLSNECSGDFLNFIKNIDETTCVVLKERITLETWRRWQKSIEKSKSLDEHVKKEFRFAAPTAETIWKQWVKIQTQRSIVVVVFTRRWVKLMQYVMRKYNIWDVKKIAEVTANICDFSNEKEHIIPIAVSILSKCWEYGVELLDWYENN